MIIGKIIAICLLCILILMFVRVCFGCWLGIKATNLIHAYNQLCWLQDEYEYCLDYDKAEKSELYQIFCPWVVSVRQCLTREAWEKVKSVKGKEKEIIIAANKKYDKLCEEIERLKNV